MGKFHISKDEQIRACRAKNKCPLGNEEEHYENKKDALQSLERKIEMEYSISQKTPQKRTPQLTQALKSKLKYTGEEPEWFNDIKSESLEKFGKPSEIIDEIEVEGKPTLVVWNDNSLRSQDRGPQKSGFKVSRLQYLDKETGKERAYLNAIYSDDDSAEKAFKNDEYTGLRYLAESESGFYGYDEDFIKKIRKLEKDEEGSSESYEAKADLWKAAFRSLHMKFGKENISSWSLSDSDVPKNEHELDKDIEEVLKVAKTHYDKYRLSSKTPKIDYSRVSEEFRGKGLGSSMYIYAAKKLAEKDLTLASSTLQSDEAMKVWRRMGKDTKIPMKVIVTKYVRGDISENSERFAIDFRKSKSVK